MLNNAEKIAYLVLFVVFFIVRKYYTSKRKDTSLVKSKLNKLDILLLSVTGIAMVVPLIYVFSDILDFADYQRSILLDIPGALILIIAIICLWLSHRDLSSNWTPTLGIKKVCSACLKIRHQQPSIRHETTSHQDHSKMSHRSLQH